MLRLSVSKSVARDAPAAADPIQNEHQNTGWGHDGSSPGRIRKNPNSQPGQLEGGHFSKKDASYKFISVAGQYQTDRYDLHSDCVQLLNEFDLQITV